MSRPGKIILSGGLILSSAAFAAWQHAVPDKPLLARPMVVAAQETKKLLVAASSPSVAEAPPAPAVAEPAPADKAPEPFRPQPRLARTEPAPQTVMAVAPALPDAQIAMAPTAPASSGRYADGEFTGIAADGQWGPVRVKILVRDGNIADVVCVEYPNHRERSAEISEWAIPKLVEETIKAQSEKIDWVTQASFTSENFQQSLASALLRAQKQPAS